MVVRQPARVRVVDGRRRGGCGRVCVPAGQVARCGGCGRHQGGVHRQGRRGQCGGGRAGQSGVCEQGAQPLGIALADGADLPGVLPAVQLQGDDGALRVQPRHRVGGGLGAVGSGHRHVRRRDRAEARRSAGRQGEHHADPVHGRPHGVEVQGEPVPLGRRPRCLEPRKDPGAGVRQRLGTGQSALVVSGRDQGQYGGTRRDPDLHLVPGQGVVLPPDQFGRHRAALPRAFCPVRSVLLAVRARGRRLLQAACRRPACFLQVRQDRRRSGPGRSGRSPGCPGPSSASPRRRATPSP